MGANPESQSWYRVAYLKPQLAGRADISRQLFRNVVWYVVRDPATGKFCRLSDTAYAVVAMMDGERNLGEIWDLACEEFGDIAPTQDDLLATVSQLYAIDLLVTDQLPDPESIASRGQKFRKRNVLTRFLNPLALRFPLFDPDTIITELEPLVRPLMNRFGAVLYLVLITAGVIAAAQNWEPLTRNLIDQVLSAQSLILLVLVYPVVKLFHELGHGFAVKRFGGEVREVGLMFLVFIPVPYVDASAATAFPSKSRRMLVGAAGILVELGLAALAMLVWTQLEEGIWRAACFSVMLIGGVSTLFFNGNPLLRFDGYYVFADYLEIPNLGARSNRYLGYLIQRYLFGVEQARSPVKARGEAPWFVFYAIAAFIYRIFISIAIISLVAGRFFVFGVLFAIWSASLMFLLPAFKHLKFLATDKKLRGLRGRAWGVSLVLVGGAVGLFGFLPLPHRTVVQGVIHAPDHATVYATQSGTVAQILQATNDRVSEGAPILRVDDPFLAAELAAAEADSRRFALRYGRALSENAFDVRLWREQMIRAEKQVEDLRARLDDLTLTAPRAGTLVIPAMSELQDNFVRRGDILAYVVNPEELLVRTAVRQENADLIRRRTQAVHLRSTEDLTRSYEGRIVREVPAIGQELASMALSTEGGGTLALDPSATDKPRSLQPIMHFDVATEGPPPSAVLESRVYVRFDLGDETLAARVWRGVRQVLLARFNV